MMVLGIFAVIVSILGVAAWSVTQDELATAGATDGGASFVASIDGDVGDQASGEGGAPLGTKAGGQDLLAQFAASKAARQASQSQPLTRPQDPKQPGFLKKSGKEGSKPSNPYTKKHSNAGLGPGRNGTGLLAQGAGSVTPKTLNNGAGTASGPVALKASSSSKGGSQGLPPGTRMVVVQEGDTLWGMVSRKVKGDASTTKKVEYTAKLNGIKAGSMKVGQKILLPHSLNKDSAPAVTAPVQKAGSKIAGEQSASPRLYTVESGDSLSSIAKALFGKESRYEEIFELNSDRLDHASEIFVGMTLRVPKK
ncbi:MAG: nucleoid-associated protein YgaU [Pseudohongiellaceae bacterium]|jgi:nucleoid-associated protein YgaU